MQQSHQEDSNKVAKKLSEELLKASSQVLSLQVQVEDLEHTLKEERKTKEKVSIILTPTSSEASPNTSEDEEEITQLRVQNQKMSLTLEMTKKRLAALNGNLEQLKNKISHQERLEATLQGLTQDIGAANDSINRIQNSFDDQ